VKRVAAFGRFWYDFVVGDDWTIAVGVVAAVALTALAAHHGLAAWPILPLAVAALLTWSVSRVQPSATSHPSVPPTTAPPPAPSHEPPDLDDAVPGDDA